MATKKTVKKTVAKKSPDGEPYDAANDAQPHAAGVGDWKVRIRMYRKWLGDCFLLTFRNEDHRSHIMIDCGVMTGTPEGKDKIVQTVDDIVEETGGELAALVVTHEHWDHVSGFSSAFDSFRKFSRIGEVWAAWTEDPNQPIAGEKRKLNRIRINAVQSALRNWNDSGSDDDRRRGSAVAALMGFVPPECLMGFSANTDSAMNNALSLGRRRLLSPGDTVEVEEIPGLRVRVLGPPKDTGALRAMEGETGKDTYGLTLGPSRIAGAEAFFTAASRRLDPRAGDPYAPFEPYLQWDEEAWKKEESWSETAGSYHGEPWRMIDSDWLNSAAELALQIDNHTNNTSLVLAFELPDSKEVLLFVGDAQIGNWRSWRDVKFSDPDVGAADLLSRTVFYKVGHHGSHNATLKQGGLEAMTSPKLVAAIPVDEEFARRPKGGCPQGWNMPAGPLLASLEKKTAGRVLRGDSDFPKNCAKPRDMSADEWEEFKRNTNVQANHIEYYIT